MMKLRWISVLVLLVFALGCKEEKRKRKDDRGRERTEKKVEKVEVQLNNISSALDGHYAKAKPNSYPESIDDLLQGDNPLLKEDALIDPWGTKITYDGDGECYEICSAGPDKKSGGGDDICKTCL